eukprot:1189819-Prorocentrum_minimum.AAC.3
MSNILSNKPSMSNNNNNNNVNIETAAGCPETAACNIFIAPRPPAPALDTSGSMPESAYTD